MKLSKMKVPFILMLIALLAGIGCIFRASGPPPESIEIFFTGDTKGELYKCG